MIFIFSSVFNIWILFIFELKDLKNINYCDIKENWIGTSFILVTTYIIFVIVVPTIKIFLFNSMTVYQTLKSNKERELKLKAKKFSNASLIVNLEILNSLFKLKNPNRFDVLLNSLRPFYKSNNQQDFNNFYQIG